jgi:hypothetical protein
MSNTISKSFKGNGNYEPCFDFLQMFNHPEHEDIENDLELSIVTTYELVGRIVTN